VLSNTTTQHDPGTVSGLLQKHLALFKPRASATSSAALALAELACQPASRQWVPSHCWAPPLAGSSHYAPAASPPQSADSSSAGPHQFGHDHESQSQPYQTHPRVHILDG
jgi:hypothetical protein